MAFAGCGGGSSAQIDSVSDILCNESPNGEWSCSSAVSGEIRNMISDTYDVRAYVELDGVTLEGSGLTQGEFAVPVYGTKLTCEEDERNVDASVGYDNGGEMEEDEGWAEKRVRVRIVCAQST